MLSLFDMPSALGARTRDRIPFRATSPNVPARRLICACPDRLVGRLDAADGLLEPYSRRRHGRPCRRARTVLVDARRARHRACRLPSRLRWIPGGATASRRAGPLEGTHRRRRPAGQSDRHGPGLFRLRLRLRLGRCRRPGDVFTSGDGGARFTDAGVFVQSDQLPGRWSRLGSALPNSPAEQVAVAPSGRYLVVATYGRSRWTYGPRT